MGPYKIKMKYSKNIHYSYKYKKTNMVRNEFLRDRMKDWNIFWVKLNWNKSQPSAVTDKISKPKFDRKERHIWNN